MFSCLAEHHNKHPHPYFFYFHLEPSYPFFHYFYWQSIKDANLTCMRTCVGEVKNSWFSILYQSHAWIKHKCENKCKNCYLSFQFVVGFLFLNLFCCFWIIFLIISLLNIHFINLAWSYVVSESFNEFYDSHWYSSF